MSYRVRRFFRKGSNYTLSTNEEERISIFGVPDEVWYIAEK